MFFYQNILQIHSTKVIQEWCRLKLKEQLTKDPPEMNPGVKLCDWTWQIFSWIEEFPLRGEKDCWFSDCEACRDCCWDFRELLVDGTIWRSFESINSFNAVDIAQNCSKEGRSLYEIKLVSLLWPVTALMWRFFESAADKTFTVVALTEWFVNGVEIPARRLIFFIMLSRVLCPWKRYGRKPNFTL